MTNFFNVQCAIIKIVHSQTETSFGTINSIKGGFTLWLKQYLNKRAIHIPCRATIVYLILHYLPKKNAPSACGENAACGYLKQYHKVLYYNLLTSGKLHSHLADVEEEAQSLFLRLVKEYAEKEGVTEQLKAENPMEWVRRMNNIRERINEAVNAEMIFT